MGNPHEVSLIAVGPLTNIGLAIKAFPEIKDNIKDVFIMGGNHMGKQMVTVKTAPKELRLSFVY